MIPGGGYLVYYCISGWGNHPYAQNSMVLVWCVMGYEQWTMGWGWG